MKSILVGIIRVYQVVFSPWFGYQCRFYPTCSEYARIAVNVHGSFKGSWLAIVRVLKCHPWHAGGEDLVPDREAGHSAPTNEKY